MSFAALRAAQALTAASEPAPGLADDFRGAMRHLASGVCVITTGEGALRTGLTATSVTSLSLDPPSLLVCINKASSVLPRLRAHGAFGVNLLGARHLALAERFAGGAQGAARYSGAEWTMLSTGASLLVDAVAAIDCRIEAITEWHTHAVVIGRVAGLLPCDADSSLVYCHGRYLEV
jgi:flavin reductase (DIM6/NTAB) family NADH-FMN oxidoreductase RutF